MSITKWIKVLIFFFMAAVATAGCDFNGVQDEARKADELQLLKSLPYASWSKKEANKDLVGVVRHDPKRAFEGYNLYTDNESFAFLINMEGKIIHRWQFPPINKGIWPYAECLPDGSILAICVGRALAKLNKDSEVIWLKEISAHHDIAPMGDGSSLVPVLQKPVDYQSRKVSFDAVAILSPSGDPKGLWSSYRHLAELQKYHGLTDLDRPFDKSGEKKNRKDNDKYDYYHLNAVEVLPKTPLGMRDKRFQQWNLLICLRNVSLVIILEQETGKVVWTYGPGILDWPHMPTMLENGHILIFDNGVHRTYSRVIEIEPVSGDIVWEYKAQPPEAFYSKWRGSNQRLPNGNTLICESENGRAFEVTPSGEIVWEFYNPVIRSGKRD